MRAAKLVLMALGLALAAPATAGNTEFIGSAKCKMCHKVQYTSWLETRHAKAFESLKPEEQAKAECLGCHATNNSAELPGVQCESCHGPGSAYKSMSVMKDSEAAMQAGLITPDEASCKSCHEKAPHEVPAFDFASMRDAGVHAHKAP